MTRRLILILGDQLSPDISSLQGGDRARDVILMAEVAAEAGYADGGLLATKPYAASAAYIDRMSDYCGACRFDPKQKTGEGACPWNALYWDFIARHQRRFAANHRMRMIVASWTRKPAEEQQALREAAADHLASLTGYRA